MGRNQRDYARYHEVPIGRCGRPARQRASCWCWLQHLDGGDGPLIFGIDETLERRRGAKIRARAIYRDPAFQPVSGGQGQRPALDLPDVAGPRALGRTPLGLAGAHGAGAFDPLLPTAGTPAQEAHRLGPPDGDALRRWLPHRPLVLVGDNNAVLDLLLPVPP